MVVRSCYEIEMLLLFLDKLLCYVYLYPIPLNNFILRTAKCSYNSQNSKKEDQSHSVELRLRTEDLEK